MYSLSESNDPFHVDDPFKTDPFHYKSVSFADSFPGDPFEVRRHQAQSQPLSRLPLAREAKGREPGNEVVKRGCFAG